MRLIILILLFGLSACNQKTKYSVDPRAKILNDSAHSIALYSSKYSEALNLLDQATEIDSNYVEAYRNKLTFLGFEPKLNLNKALVTLKSLIRLRPGDPENFMYTGLIYLKKGDTTIANVYLLDAIAHYDKILDTMNRTNKSYELLLMNKGSSLILLGQEKEGKRIFSQLKETSTDTVFKQLLFQIMNRTRQNILDSLNVGE